MTNSALFFRRLRQVHLWLGIAIGVQVIIWLVSGLFMVWFDIDKVRGNHLVDRPAPSQLIWTPDLIPPEDAIAASGLIAWEARATRVATVPVWIVYGPSDERVMVNARTGEIWSPIDEAYAEQKATLAYQGTGAVERVLYLDERPREASGDGPVWRIDFGPEDKTTLYIDAFSGDLGSVRTPLWRAFDFMWGLHIMDWSTRENFNSWWIKTTAVIGVLFGIAGAILAMLRIRLMLQRRQRS